MDKSHYFRLMRETAASSFAVISRYLDAAKDLAPELHQILRHIVDRRSNDLLLKPFLLRLTYELCGGTEWQTTLPAGAAFEMLNISSYQANSSFDDKHAVLSLQEKNSQFLASMITRELCVECLDEAQQHYDAPVIEKIRDDLSTCNKHIYVAQHYDLNLLTMERLDAYADASAFMRDYTSRCFHGSGVFTGRCARAGAILAGASHDEIVAVQAFGEHFGTGLHFMNDLADFVPPSLGKNLGRSFQDQLSDIRNGRLTLGCYLLKSNDKCESNGLLRAIQAGDVSPRTLASLIAVMNREGIIGTIRKCGKVFAGRARAAIASFNASQTKALLSLMTSACYSNKYTRAMTACSTHYQGDGKWTGKKALSLLPRA